MNSQSLVCILPATEDFLFHKFSGEIVRSLSLEIAQKYGAVIPIPVLELSDIEGFKNPDLLSTVGSGCENTGK